MDTIWFQEAVRRTGGTQADLARDLRLAPSAVSRMIKGERQMKVQEAVKIARFLNVPEEEVLRRAGSDTASRPGPTTPARRGRPPRSPVPAAAPAPWRDQIPIRGAAYAPGDEPVGYTPRPANLLGVNGAYAMYMADEGLSPRYEVGWLLHVHPFKPPTSGRDVVVARKDRQVLIKQFVGWRDDVLVLRRLNPAETLSIPRDEVAACHLIVGVDQES